MKDDTEQLNLIIEKNEARIPQLKFDIGENSLDPESPLINFSNSLPEYNASNFKKNEDNDVYVEWRKSIKFATFVFFLILICLLILYIKACFTKK